MSDVALVTGASRGLGAAIAEFLARRYHVVAVARTTGGLEELDDRIRADGGEGATLAPADITDKAAMQALCRGIYDRWGTLSLWVHTAMQTPPLAPASQIDQGDWDRALACNVAALGVLIPYVAPLLGTEGRAVFFDDAAAAPGGKFMGAYGACKAAQMALARSWQAESVRTGPEVSILSPRPMRTALRGRFYPGEDRDALASPMREAARLLGDTF